MKKYIAALVLAVTVGGSWLAYSYFAAGPVASESKPAQEVRYSASGQKLFWAKIRHNQVTGELPVNDVLQARLDAKHYAGLGLRGALNLDWEEMGPDNQGGRTRAILIDKDNPNKMFAGGVSGGLFVSNNAGASWDRVPGSDDFDNHIVNCIAQAANGNIYFGTGELFPGFATGTGSNGAGGFVGNGIWRSNDGGQTWVNIKAPAVSNSTTDPWAFVHDMKRDGADGNKIWVGNNAANTADGLFTIDATNDNVSPFAGMANGAVHDIECGSDGSVHVAKGRPGSSTQYYRKKAGESTFAGVSIPNATSLTRLNIAIAPSNPNVLYYAGVFSQNGDVLRGVWHTADAGDNFTQIAGQ
ncbi:MAG TPA: hypothetical protein VEY71_09425, partial [Chitinophagales bacterium]|nr:hypothetical protein [Chitinophagales bacterium]